MFVALLLSRSGMTWACTQEVSAADFERAFPEGKLLRGDLNADGISDFAVFYMEKATGERLDRIAIYEGRSNGSYCLTVKSGRLDFGRTDVEVKKGSVFITATSNSIKEWASETYQFKYRGGRYLLIGMEERASYPDEGVEHADSRNYLTGKRIEKTTRNKKTTEKMSAIGTDEMALLPLDQFER